MTRKFIAAMLVVTFVSLSLPSASAAGETVKQTPAPATLSNAITRAAVAEARLVQSPNLQQTPGQAPAAPQSGGGGGLSKGAKIGIGAAAVAAAIAVGFAVAKGPDPRPWP